MLLRQLFWQQLSLRLNYSYLVYLWHYYLAKYNYTYLAYYSDRMEYEQYIIQPYAKLLSISLVYIGQFLNFCAR